MRLADLLRDLPGVTLIGSGETGVTSMTADSRQVVLGSLFAALPGVKRDGLDFVAQAIAAGASALLIPENAPGLSFEGVSLVRARDARLAFSLMAARLYAPQPQTVVAVTGTNGKTSTVVFARQLWAALGHKAASLGTLGLTGLGFDDYDGMTTPDPVALHKALGRAALAGCSHLAMEASSHGLDQRRLDGVSIKAAAFTNLTRDHLDYHGTEDAYFAAKARLFTELLPKDHIAVLNADDPRFPMLRQAVLAAGRRVWSYGENGEDLRLVARHPALTGQRVTLKVLGESVESVLPLVGAFQVFNVLAAVGLVVAAGEDPRRVLTHLSALTGVPGRMQLAGKRASGAPVYVDFSHTPDSLENALKALRPHVKGRLIVVFGCGGDRDPGKRPMMGEIAARLADVALVTDDNPRTEDPATIRAAVMATCTGGEEFGDRRHAIQSGVARLLPDDILLIAGKGHEHGQIVGTQVLPFDDLEEAHEAIRLADAGVASGKDIAP